MMHPLESQLVGFIREIDAEQDEGGVYSMPDKYSEGNWPAPHHRLFGGDFEEISVCTRLELTAGRKRQNAIQFKHADEVCSLRFIDIATTKIRSYGNRYLLDSHHGKKWEDRSAEVRDAVLNLVKEAKRGWAHCDRHLLLALIFTDTEKHAQETLSRSIESNFVERYHLTVATDSWPDPHGRQLWTTAGCWSVRRPRTG